MKSLYLQAKHDGDPRRLVTPSKPLSPSMLPCGENRTQCVGSGGEYHTTNSVQATYRCFRMPVKPGKAFAHARMPTLSSLELMRPARYQAVPTVNSTVVDTCCSSRCELMLPQVAGRNAHSYGRYCTHVRLRLRFQVTGGELAAALTVSQRSFIARTLAAGVAPSQTSAYCCGPPRSACLALESVCDLTSQ